MNKILTNSQRTSFFKCPRKWHFENILKRRPIQSADALVFGTAFHALLEAYWTGKDTQPRELPNAFEQAKLSAMLDCYIGRWGAEDSKHSNVRAEVEFKIPIKANERNSAWVYSGKIDAVCEDSEGLWLVEHKTSSQDISAGSEYWSRLEIDGQIEGYMLGYIKATGEIPLGVIYDVAKKPCIKPLRQDKANPETPEEYRERCKAKIMEEPEKYLVRQKIYKTADKINEFERTLYHSAKMIDYSINNDFFPSNADGCKGFSTCPYFEVCAGHADIADDFRFADTQQNPELQEA